jgi:hypothetical protein
MATKCARLLLILVALAAVTYDAQGQGGNDNPGVIPPNARYRGLTYGEWGARWWQAALTIPVVDGYHPLISGGAFGGDEGVVFLSQAYVVGGNVTVDITIPSGTALLVPVVNAECSMIEPPPFHGDDEESLRACANAALDATSGWSAVIDGRPVNNLDAYRTDSPLFTFGPLPANNYLAFFGVDAPAGATSPSVDAGVYLLLTPLSVGQHVVSVSATFPPGFGGTIVTTFNITVVPRGRS